MRTRGARLLVAFVFCCITVSFQFPLNGFAARRDLSPTHTYTYVPFTVKQRGIGVYILSNSFLFVSASGSLHILGEIANYTDQHLDEVVVSASLYDKKIKLLGTQSTPIFLDHLPAGQKTCFDITFLSPPSGWKTFDFGEPVYTTPGEALPNLAVLNQACYYDNATGDFTITGKVYNDHGSRVEYVKPVGALYNSSGKVIGCTFNYINGYHLNAAQTGDFSLVFYGRNYLDVASFQIQVDGNP